MENRWIWNILDQDGYKYIGEFKEKNKWFKIYSMPSYKIFGQWKNGKKIQVKMFFLVV